MTKKEELLEYVNNNITENNSLYCTVEYSNVTSELLKDYKTSGLGFKFLTKEQTLQYIELSCDDNLFIYEKNLTKQIKYWETI